VRLDGEYEPFRGDLGPPFCGAFGGEVVEGVVDLHRWEVPGVKGKLTFLRKVRRVEDPGPVGVDVSRSAHVDHLRLPKLRHL